MPIIFHRHLSLGTLLYTLAILGIVGVLVSYGLFQARYIIAGPTIALTVEPATLQEGQTVAVEGVAENIVALALNGRTIFTDDQGRFSETLVLPTGYTIMTLTAHDRYGRSTSLERTFVAYADQ